MFDLRRLTNRLRFDYLRSFHRASRAQIERFMHNRINRPAARHPRRFVSIGLTHRCQRSCDWCATGAFSKRRKDEFTTAEVERLLRQVAQSRFVFDNISFLGGECLLRPDIHHLVRYATGLGLFVHLSTNGLKLDHPTVGQLTEAGLNSVFVALSPTPPRDPEQERHQQAVLRGVESCLRQDLPCFLSVCVCKENVFSGDLERTIELARQLGVAGVRLMPVRLSGKWLWQQPDQVLDEREERKVRDLCKTGFAFLTDDCSKEACVRCPAVRRSLAYISPYGEVHPCHFFPFSFGDIRARELDSVLQRMWQHPLLCTEGYTCLLHDEDFRAQHIMPISPEVQLPVAM